MVKRIGELSTRDLLIFFLPSFLIMAIGFIAAYQFVEPSPPRTIRIATGEKGGAYYSFANEYKKLLQDQGVELIITETSGAVENLALLGTEEGGVDVAFIQGGVGIGSDLEDVLSIASLYYEPLWGFLRSGLEVNGTSQLKGLKVAVGREGSGTRLLVLQLLRVNGVTDKNTTLVTMDAKASADRLLNGEIDAAFFVSTHWANQVERLLKAEGPILMGVERAHAYSMRFNYLNVINIPRGVINFEKDIPQKDLQLLSPTAQLAIRSDLHPALIDLLLQTTKKVHSSGGLLEKKGQFPSPHSLDFEFSPDAERFFNERTPFLQRYLPFWVANLLSRIKVMILPLIAIVFPMFKLMPFLYRWRVRSRIYRWYSDLDKVGSKINAQDIEKTFEAHMHRLDEIERSVAKIKVPEPYAEGLFHLRLHIDMFRRKLLEASKGAKG